MNANPPKKSPATVTSEPQELEHEIRLRAQELYEARGREDGHELDDSWQRESSVVNGRWAIWWRRQHDTARREISKF